ncbi:hypothetical protein BHM03_00026321 [Ensete ventricosum]|nr:hypothetical protein BHM03_00026321 [Ensete ventricosum]
MARAHREFTGGCQEFADRWSGVYWEFVGGLLGVRWEFVDRRLGARCGFAGRMSRKINSGHQLTSGQLPTRAIARGQVEGAATRSQPTRGSCPRLGLPPAWAIARRNSRQQGHARRGGTCGQRHCPLGRHPGAAAIAHEQRRPTTTVGRGKGLGFSFSLQKDDSTP